VGILYSHSPIDIYEDIEDTSHIPHLDPQYLWFYAKAKVPSQKVPGDSGKYRLDTVHR
jgi:hypothetical protein